MGIRKGEIAGATVAVTGLHELMKALRNMDKAQRREVALKLRAVGEVVAEQARANVRAKTVTRTGRLLRAVGVRVFQRSIAVVAAAKAKSRKYPRGYNYPRRLEYGFGGRFTFLRPALKAKQAEAAQKMEEVLETMEKEWA